MRIYFMAISTHMIVCSRHSIPDKLVNQNLRGLVKTDQNTVPLLFEWNSYSIQTLQLSVWESTIIHCTELILILLGVTAPRCWNYMVMVSFSLSFFLVLCIFTRTSNWGHGCEECLYPADRFLWLYLEPLLIFINFFSAKN